MPLLGNSKSVYVGTTPITKVMSSGVQVWPKTVDAFENIRCLGYYDPKGPGSGGCVNGVMILWNTDAFLTCEESKRRLWVRAKSTATSTWTDWILCVYFKSIRISSIDPTLKYGADGCRTDEDAVPRYWQWKYVFDDGTESVSPEIELDYNVENQSEIYPWDLYWQTCYG
jgi:hypothetical protein